jgi:hypothetical protein
MHTGPLGRLANVSLSDLRVTLDADRRPRWWTWRLFSLAAPAVLAASLSLILVACGSGSLPTRSDVAEVPGAITLNNGPINDLPSAGGGTGTVYFHGNAHRFAIGGDGVDGSAVAIIETSGEVYRLDDIAQFAGVYRRASSVSPVAGASSGGLWLQNDHGATIHLRTPPGGRMPDIGHDAVRIVLEE